MGLFRVNLKLNRNDMDVLCTNIKKVLYFIAECGVNVDAYSLIDKMNRFEVLRNLLHRLNGLYRPGRERYSVRLNVNEAFCVVDDVLPIMEAGYEYESVQSRIIRDEIFRQIDTQWTAFKGRINS